MVVSSSANEPTSDSLLCQGDNCPALGQFIASEWLCELDSRFVLSASPERIASTIVHEAVHARIERRGIAYSEGIRHRIEMVCVTQQQAFARKHSDAGPMEDELERRLGLPPENWSDEMMERRHRRGSVEVLKELKMPDWLIVALLRSHRASKRRRRRKGELDRRTATSP